MRNQFIGCPDCGRSFSGEFQYAVHRAYKHDDWKLLDEWYKKRGKEPFYVK